MVPQLPREHLLYHAAARLRAGEFNFLSLETVLSDAGVISQVPIDWITLMSSGRSHVVNCRDHGRIEFVHTVQRPNEVAGELSWDREKHLWRASVRQALRDMRATRRRSQDLIDEEVLTERLSTRYDLPVQVSEPKQTAGRVSTWKLRIETRPEQRHLPAQRIHLDILKEMRRFLPSATVGETLQKEDYWQWLRGVVFDLSRLID